jgi:hypothetical protein
MGGDRGPSRELFFWISPLEYCSSARPQDRLWIGPRSSILPSPPLPSPLFPPTPFSYIFFASCRITLLVSSPAGRSFFEKTTRARTRPTPPFQKLKSLPHPNRRYSSSFVSIFTSAFDQVDLYPRRMSLSSGSRISRNCPWRVPQSTLLTPIYTNLPRLLVLFMFVWHIPLSCPLYILSESGSGTRLCFNTS